MKNTGVKKNWGQTKNETKYAYIPFHSFEHRDVDVVCGLCPTPLSAGTPPLKNCQLQVITNHSAKIAAATKTKWYQNKWKKKKKRLPLTAWN